MKTRSRFAVGSPLRALKEVRDEPREAAKGFALGIFFAMSPFVLIKIVLALLLSSLFRWNRAATTIGVLTANPLTVPFIFSIAYFVGAAILGMESAVDVNALFSQQGISQLLSESKDIVLALLLGGTLAGLVAGVLAYYVAYFALRRQRIEDNLQPSPVPVVVRQEE